MPAYDYRCKGCGWVETDFRRIDERDDPFTEECPIRCDKTDWMRITTLPAQPACLKDKKRFPHTSHLRENTIDRTPEGRMVPGTKPVVFNSRSHMERYMKDNGYVHYETPLDGGTQAQFGKMPAHLKAMEKDHPVVRKYLDLKKSGRIPQSMMLDDEQLKERFVT